MADPLPYPIPNLYNLRPPLGLLYTYPIHYLCKRVLMRLRINSIKLQRTSRRDSTSKVVIGHTFFQNEIRKLSL